MSSCAVPDCPALTDRGRCETHRLAARRDIDRRRLGARARGYTTAWERFRDAYLAEHPTCECENPACRKPSSEVHHLDGRGPDGPHGLDAENVVALEHDCHSKLTARLQPGGWNR